jgi:predicted enzyme related to lactoylglutathione lyase
MNQLSDMASGIRTKLMRRQAGGLRRAWCQSICACLVGCVLASTALGETARIKRISLMTRDLDRSIAFFTEVVGFSLDLEGTLPANGEPFLGPVFNIDASQPIRRALLSTSQEPRGLFLIEHPEAPLANPVVPTATVTVVEVADIQGTLNRAAKFGAPVSETVTDTTPEGLRFSEAMITSPGGHAILVYEIGALTDAGAHQTE